MGCAAKRLAPITDKRYYIILYSLVTVSVMLMEWPRPSMPIAVQKYPPTSSCLIVSNTNISPVWFRSIANFCECTLRKSSPSLILHDVLFKCIINIPNIITISFWFFHNYILNKDHEDPTNVLVISIIPILWSRDYIIGDYRSVMVLRLIMEMTDGSHILPPPA